MGLYVEYLKFDTNKIICHKIGNKLRGEGVSLSHTPLLMSELDKARFLNFAISSFTDNKILYNLFHECDITCNILYDLVSKIFENKDSFIDVSQDIAKHLYEISLHPKISSGDLFIVYMEDCIINGETVDAVGVFKSEVKKIGLVLTQDNDYLNSESVIDIENLDMGAIIYNTQKEKGYLVQAVYNLSKSNTRYSYWYDDFLHIILNKDSRFYTEEILKASMHFIKDVLSIKYETTDIIKAELLSQVAKYFEENDTFDLEEFTQTIFNGETSVDFLQYLSEFEGSWGVQFPLSFIISQDVFKSLKRKLKYQIKINKDIEISLKGSIDSIQEHKDDNGKQYYKIYIQK